MPKSPEATAPKQHPADELRDVLVSFSERVLTEYRLLSRAYPGQHHEQVLGTAISNATTTSLYDFIEANADPQG